MNAYCDYTDLIENSTRQVEESRVDVDISFGADFVE